MKRYITIDGGTTNTRIYLVENGDVTDTVRINIGFNRPTSREEAVPKIREAIKDLLLKHSLSERDIERIIASGMLTSEFGLYKLDHTIAPAGISELHKNSREVMLEEISTIPFYFVCGVKTVGESLVDLNMMRGEETELMGIRREDDGECIYILPGSHSKLARLDGNGKIIDFKSTLTGEMIAAMTKSTILSTCVDLTANLYEPALIEGYDYAKEYGVNETLLKTRTLQGLLKKDKDYLYSFFMGAILCDEIKAIVKMPENKVIISGRAEIKAALSALLKSTSDKTVIELDQKTIDNSTVRGAIKIYEYGK